MPTAKRKSQSPQKDSDHGSGGSPGPSKKHKRHKKKHKRTDEEKTSSSRKDTSSGSKKSRRRQSKSPERKASPSPTPGGDQHVESLSIAETNKLREKLGLPPLRDNDEKPDNNKLTADGLTTFKDENDGKEYVHKPADNWADKKASEALKEHLATQKEKRKVQEKLSRVRGLGEAAKGESESAADWVQKTRKLEEEKRLAAERQKLLDDMDSEFGVGNLLEEEFAPKKVASRKRAVRGRQGGPAPPKRSAVAGLKVEHSKDAFLEGKETILVLKDKHVLAEDEVEVLVNPTLQEHELWAKSAELRKKKPGYNPFEEELDPLAPPRELLSQYDEEIGGPKRDSFVLDDRGQVDLTTEQIQASVRAKLKASEQDLESKPLELAKEYYTKDEMISFKKPKKIRKVKKRGRMVTADDLLKDALPDAAPVDQDLGSRATRSSTKRDQAQTSGVSRRGDPRTGAVAAPSKPEAMEVELRLSREDDDEDDLIGPNEDVLAEPLHLSEDEAELELASVLERTRRLKAATVKMEPVEEKILGTLKDVIKPEPMDDADVPAAENGDVANDDSRDGGIGVVFDVVSEYCRGLGDIPTFGMAGNRRESEVVKLEPGEEAPSRRMEAKMEQSSDEEEDWGMREASPAPRRGGAWVEAGFGEGELPSLEGRRRRAKSGGSGGDMDEDEEILDKEPDVRKGVAGALQVAVQKGYINKEKVNVTNNERLKHMYAQRYAVEDKQFTDIDDKYSRKLERMGMGGPITDFKEKSEYKPDFKLEYADERGKLMTPKEAFQYQSWKFHGKKPGKNKLEKVRKKEREERLMNEMSSTDTPLATLQKQLEKQKQVQQPFIVLSGRGAKEMGVKKD